MKRRDFLKLVSIIVMTPKLLSSVKIKPEFDVILIDEQLKLINFNTKPQMTIANANCGTEIKWLVDEKRYLSCLQVYDIKNKLVFEQIVDVKLLPGDTFTATLSNEFVENTLRKLK